MRNSQIPITPRSLVATHPGRERHGLLALPSITLLFTGLALSGLGILIGSAFFGALAIVLIASFLGGTLFFRSDG